MNKNKNNKLIIMAVVLICLIFSKINVLANASNEVSPEALAVTLVIDTSGSMAKTDPQRLRETAASIFIDLLGSEDYLSIIAFNTKAETVLPIQKVQSSDNKAAFKKILSQKLQPIGDTDYLLALNEAGKQLDSVKEGNVRKVILFLTDGVPDPNPSISNKDKDAFMNSYMDSLWKAVADLALNKYSVYSIGFSKEIDPSILEKISNDTHGTLKISDDSSELALNFFNILGSLKNSKEFLKESFELKGNQSLEFDLDEYTTQTTMVITNSSGSPFDVALSAPEGKDVKNAVTINKSDKYSIVTINQGNEKFAGKWRINLQGNGSINAFGNKELLIKSQLVNPEPGSLHPLNEPLEISVNVTGEVKEGVSIEALVAKDGVKDDAPIKLINKDGVFTGTYNKADKAGKYDVEIKLMLNGQEITKNNTSFFVRELPSISTDFLGKDTVYRLGEGLTVTSTLQMTGNKMLNSSDLNIENYNLVINYANSGIETIPLLDNGTADTGDAKAKDGIWSNKVLFNKEDGGRVSLIVNGTYKGERFLVEKSLGNVRVYPSGKLIIKPLSNNLSITANNQFKIPLEIENTSSFTETMIISIDNSIGQLEQKEIKIDPLKAVKTEINVKLNENLEKKIYEIVFKIQSEDTRTIVEPAEFVTKVQVISKAGYLVRSLKDNLTSIIMILGSLIGIALIIILPGLLLHRMLVYKNAIIPGKLSYYKESDTELKLTWTFDFSKLSKDRIVITFNEESKDNEFYIWSDEYNYDIELTSMVQKSRFKFMDGYKALFRRNNSSELLLKTTEPGIFIYEDKVFTSKKIYNNDMFITGGYVFRYFINDEKKSADKDKGRNVLRGK
jgi:Mg-chelatase subunit ChlD/methionine-rich copper-binding protein CopC